MTVQDWRRCNIAIVDDDGTVFEAEGMAQISYKMTHEPLFTDSFLTPVAFARRELKVEMTMTDFEGSITVPHEVLR